MNDANQPDATDESCRSDSASVGRAIHSQASFDIQNIRSDSSESLDAALNDLRHIGIRIPRHPSIGRVLLEAWITGMLLRLRGSKLPRAIPELTNQEQIAVSLKIDRSVSLAFFDEPLLAAFLVSRQVRILLTHGLAESAARSLALFGMMQNSRYIRRYSSAAAYARLATRVATDSRLRHTDTPKSTDWKGLLFPWTYPRRLIPKLIRAQLAPIKNSSDLSTTIFSIDYELLGAMFTCDTLEKILECTRATLAWANQIQDSYATRHTLLLEKIITRSTDAKSDANISPACTQPDERFLKQAERDGDAIGVSFHWSLIGAMAAVWGRYEEAALAYGYLKKFKKAGQKRGDLLVPISPQCRVLLIHAGIAAIREQRRRSYRQLVKFFPDIRFVYCLAKANPAGFSWAWNLLCAELARIFGKTEQAFKYYRLARSNVKDSGYLLPLAIVQECLGRFSFEQQDEVLAGQQLSEACQVYNLWGCEAKGASLSSSFSCINSFKSKRQVISAMQVSESTQDVVNKLDARLAGSRPRLPSELNSLNTIIDQIRQKDAEKKIGSLSVIDLLDSYIEEAKSKARVDINKTISDSFRRGMLQERIEEIPGIDMNIYYQAAQPVGGDLVGYHYDPIAGRLCLQIGDVMGVGPSAVLVSTAVSSAITTFCQSLPNQNLRFDEIIFELARIANETVLRFGGRLNCSMTMSFILLDIVAGQGCFLNAAHTPVYLKQKSRVSTMIRPGLPLGDFGFNEQCVLSRFLFEPGDSLFLYTDGLVKNKSISGQSLSRRTIRRIIAESIGAKDCYQNVVTAYGDKTADSKLIDDCAFIVVGRYV